VVEPGREHVEVLISTFGPSRHLSEQLASLRAQTHTNWSLRIRDDGSPGGPGWLSSVSGLEDAAVLAGERVGAADSFLRLLGAADTSADYVAFCDQDDVWLPEKLSRAVRALAQLAEDTPALWCSRVIITDADLREIGRTPLPRRGPSVANALVQNIAPGCTMMLNRAAAALLRRATPSHHLMHDAWAYLVVAACGTVLHDDEPTVLYRQHHANSIGIGRTRLGRWRSRISRQAHEGHLRLLSRQADELRDLYGDVLRPDARTLVDAFLEQRGLRQRILAAPRLAVYRQSVLDDVIMRALYVADRL
jgi:glycosyltransferase involved in cell wall biosynthesis